jgi:hypothetical protein
MLNIYVGAAAEVRRQSRLVFLGVNQELERLRARHWRRRYDSVFRTPQWVKSADSSRKEDEESLK